MEMRGLPLDTVKDISDCGDAYSGGECAHIKSGSLKIYLIELRRENTKD